MFAKFLKDFLATGAMNHVLSLGGDSTLPTSKRSSNADICDNNHVDVSETKSFNERIA